MDDLSEEASLSPSVQWDDSTLTAGVPQAVELRAVPIPQRMEAWLLLKQEHPKDWGL